MSTLARHNVSGPALGGASGTASAKYNALDNPVYQIDFAAASSGKRVAQTKRRVRWRFGFSNRDALSGGQRGVECRGEEHDVTLVWSLTSGKRLVLADGHEVHFSTGKRTEGKFQCSWTMAGNHVLKIIAHAAPPLQSKPGWRQFDLHLDGMSFFDMPKIYELGVTHGGAAAAVVPYEEQEYARSAQQPRPYSNYSMPREEEIRWANAVDEHEQRRRMDRGMSLAYPNAARHTEGLNDSYEEEQHQQQPPSPTREEPPIRSLSMPSDLVSDPTPVNEMRDLVSAPPSVMDQMHASAPTINTHAQPPNHYASAPSLPVYQEDEFAPAPVPPPAPPTVETIHNEILGAYDSAPAPAAPAPTSQALVPAPSSGSGYDVHPQPQPQAPAPAPVYYEQQQPPAPAPAPVYQEPPAPAPEPVYYEQQPQQYEQPPQEPIRRPSPTGPQLYEQPEKKSLQSQFYEQSAKEAQFYQQPPEAAPQMVSPQGGPPLQVQTQYEFEKPGQQNLVSPATSATSASTMSTMTASLHGQENPAADNPGEMRSPSSSAIVPIVQQSMYGAPIFEQEAEEDEPTDEYSRSVKSLVNIDDISAPVEKDLPEVKNPFETETIVVDKKTGHMSSRGLPPTAPTWSLGAQPALADIKANTTPRETTKEVMKPHAFHPQAAQEGMMVVYGQAPPLQQMNGFGAGANMQNGGYTSVAQPMPPPQQYPPAQYQQAPPPQQPPAQYAQQPAYAQPQIYA